MMRWMLVMLVALALGCGGDKPAPVGVKKPNNNDEDFGVVTRPDMRDNNTPNLNNPPVGDAGPDLDTPDVGPVPDLEETPDLGVDMAEDMNTGPNCPRMNVMRGGACRCNQECSSGVCADASVAQDGFCTSSCTRRTDCPSGQACVSDRFGTAVCRADDTGTSCAEAGQAAPDQCSSGYCVQAGSNFPIRHFCSVPCSSATECMLGHACTPVRCQFSPLDGYRCLPNVVVQRAPNTPQVLLSYPEATKLCIKVGDPNPCGATTMASDEQACPGSMCDASPTGRCTSACSTTLDCPAGGCVDFDTSDPNLPIRVCDL